MEQKAHEITGQELINAGFKEGKIIGIILRTIQKHFKEDESDATMALLINVLNDPHRYADDAHLSEISKELTKPEKDFVLPLRDTPDTYKIYGAEAIEQGAIRQIETAMRLPIAKAGALMPDAHQGYGLPIGGVLATENAVIPYGVGVDIGCRMCMTIHDIEADILNERKEDLKSMLVKNTKFGRASFKSPIDHPVLQNKLFDEIKIVGDLKDRAAAQIGSSGGGNHFVEFGITHIIDPQNEFQLPVGHYLAVLSHSGSRGFGANIASYYTKKAMEVCKLPHEARHLAWLDLDTELGQEYWLAMNLAGEYASACHHQIHDRMAFSLGASPVTMIENHHNFAWKETDIEGNEIIVHRKGATPAGKGEVGIIPGSMTDPGYIVRGKGDDASINSAAHGAGRVMSRTRAKNTLDKSQVAKHIEQIGVEVIGSGLDEAPMAYKDIKKVMEAQKDLVDVIGTFQPKIVRMCGDEQFKEVD